MPVGTYTVSVKYTANSNYQVTVATDIDFTVNQKTLTVTFKDDYDSVFDGSQQTVTPVVGTHYTVVGEIDGLASGLSVTATGTAVGAYDFAVSITNANYNLVVEGADTYKFKIAPASITNVSANIEEVTYKAAAYDFIITATTVGSTAYTVYYSATELTAENYTAAANNYSVTNAGTYTIY